MAGKVERNVAADSGVISVSRGIVTSKVDRLGMYPSIAEKSGIKQSRLA